MRSSWEGCRQSGAWRGQSTTLGFVLVFAIVLGGTTLVLAAGSGALADAQQDVSVERAEKSLAEVDSKAAMVGLGQSTSQSVSLSTTQGGDYRVNDTAGNINVTLFPGGGGSTVLVNQSLGELRYESGQTTVAYQGGGVWRQTGNGSTMVSPPEFHYRDLTLTLPIVRIDGQGSVGDSVTVSKNETAIEKFPTSSTENPLDDARVRVKVQSEYYQAWGTFFEERTEGNATVYHSNNTAVLDLVTPAPDQPQPVAGVVSGAAAGQTVLDDKACIDSYNSSDTGWTGAWHHCDNGINNKSIVTKGDIKVTDSQTKIVGNVTAGGDVKLVSSGKINGNVFCAKGNANCVNDVNDVTKTVYNTNKEVPDPEPVDDLVEDKIQAMKTSNDNGAETDISSNRIDRDSGTEKVTAGRYYLTKLDRDEDLILDTSGGDIVLAIDGKFDLDGATVEVRGDNALRIYVAELGGSNSEMNFDNNARLITKDGGSVVRNSTRVWVYGTPGFDFDINSGSRFTGVIYAPEGPGTAAGQVNVQGSAIFGAVVAHVTKMDDGSKDAYIHYDTALSTTTATRAADPGDPRITNVHLTVNRINVTG